MRNLNCDLSALSVTGVSSYQGQVAFTITEDGKEAIGPVPCEFTADLSDKAAKLFAHPVNVAPYGVFGDDVYDALRDYVKKVCSDLHKARFVSIKL